METNTAGQPVGTVKLTRYVPLAEATTQELIDALKLNRSDMDSNWSYHGLRPGIRREQDDVARELTRRGVDVTQL